MIQFHDTTWPQRLAAGLIAVAGLVATLTPAHAGQEFAPRAMEVLKAMSATLAGAKTLTVRSTSLFDAVQPGGIAIKVSQEVHVQLKRPNKLNARVQRDDGSRRHLWFDGKSATVYDPDENSYSVVEVRTNLDGMFRKLDDEYGLDVPLSDLLLSDPYTAFEEHLISAAYLGKRMIEGVEAHHLSFESSGTDFQLWVTADERALPLRFAINYVTEAGEPGFLAMIGDWRLAPYVDEGAFVFHPPEGAKKVPLLKADQ